MFIVLLRFRLCGWSPFLSIFFFCRLGLLLASSFRASSASLVCILIISLAPSSCVPLSRSSDPHVFFLPIVSSEGCQCCGCSRKPMGALFDISSPSSLAFPAPSRASACCPFATSLPALMLRLCRTWPLCLSVATPVGLGGHYGLHCRPRCALLRDLPGHCVAPCPPFLPRLSSAVVCHSLQCKAHVVWSSSGVTLALPRRFRHTWYICPVSLQP